MKLKRILIILAIFFTCQAGSFAQDEVILEEINFSVPKKETKFDKAQQMTLKGEISKFDNFARKDKGLIFYRMGLGDEHRVYTSTVFNTIDNENKHIESFRLNLSGEIAPHIKYCSYLKTTNMFDRVDSSAMYHNSYIYTDIVPNHKIYFGQAKLSRENGQILNFIESYENSYGQNDIGVKVSGDHNLLKYSFGTYNSSDFNFGGNSMAAGGTLALKPVSLAKGLGDLEFGGGYYTKNTEQTTKSTYGLFSGYNINRLYLKGEVARKEDSISNYTSDSVHLSNILKITNNLNFITKFNQVLETQELKNDFAIEYKAGQNSLIKLDHLRFELSASQIKDNTYNDRRRYGFKTKYLF